MIETKIVAQSCSVDLQLSHKRRKGTVIIYPSPEDGFDVQSRRISYRLRGQGVLLVEASYDKDIWFAITQCFTDVITYTWGHKSIRIQGIKAGILDSWEYHLYCKWIRIKLTGRRLVGHVSVT